MRHSMFGAFRVCEKCQQPFCQYRVGARQIYCPTCVDIVDSRPTIVTARNRLAAFDGVRIESLPPKDWKKFQARCGDEPRYKCDVRGSLLGDPWKGRIVLWSDRKPEVGDIVRLRHMVALHDNPRTEEEERHEYVALEHRGQQEAQWSLQWLTDEAVIDSLWWMSVSGGEEGKEKAATFAVT